MKSGTSTASRKSQLQRSGQGHAACLFSSESESRPLTRHHQHCHLLLSHDNPGLHPRSPGKGGFQECLGCYRMKSGTSAASKRSLLQRSAQSNATCLFSSENEARSLIRHQQLCHLLLSATTPDYIRGHPEKVGSKNVLGATG